MEIEEKIKLPTGFYWENEKEKKYVICEKDNSKMVYIPAGKFILGSTRWNFSQPVQEVYLDAYFIDVYPVTNAQFKKFMDAGGYTNKEYWGDGFWEVKEKKGWKEPYYWNNKRFGIAKPNHPVVGISWYEAYAYCNWAGKSLPTECQWEKAAKGGIYLDGDDSNKVKNPLPERIYPWGNEKPDEDGIFRANYYYHPVYGHRKGTDKGTSPVGFFKDYPSPYGCYDLAGNVYEWCLDEYDSNFYKNIGKNNKNPKNFDKKSIKNDGLARILRGGSWRHLTVRLVTSFRDVWYWCNARFGLSLVGFRCVSPPSAW